MASRKEMEKFLEEHRHKYEPVQHWKARKQFMINNWDRYSGNQLVSLSMVWSNMEFDGATYPVELMTRVKEMAKGITVDDWMQPDTNNRPTQIKGKPGDKSQNKPSPLLELESPAMQREQVKRGIDEDEMRNNKVQKTERRQSAKERAIAGYDTRLGKTSSTSQAIPRSKPTFGSGSGQEKVIADLAYNLKKQSTTNNRVGSALNRLHNAGLRLSLRPEVEYIEIPPPNTPHAKRGWGKSPLDNPTWLCNLYMGDTLLASVEANNKPNSKTAAAEKAVFILESSRFTVNTVKKSSKLGRSYTREVVPSDKELNSQRFPVNVQNKCGAPPPTGNIDKFVLTEPMNPAPAVSILSNSAQSNHVPILFETSDDVHTVNGKSGFVCKTIINGVTVDIGIHMNRKEARNVSAENTLATLRKTCPVLKKNLDGAQASAIKREELATSQQAKPKQEAEPITDSNLGHKMLTMMGWTGGALGKDGIVEPIQASEKFSREGFGYTIAVPKNSTNKIDLQAVRKILEDFVHSGRRDDLIFSSELSSDERKAIHLLCRRFDLKSQSHGKGRERFLVVRQRRKLSELVQDVVESGGTCGQYELVSPGQGQ